MAGEAVNFSVGFVGAYTDFMGTLPSYFQSFINIFLLVLLIMVYAFLVWKFYKSVSKKNLLELNLNKYNTSHHPGMAKFVAGLLYLLEYVIILPVLVSVWFIGFSFFLLLLSNNLDVQTILFLSVTLIAAIRMTSYLPKHGQTISQEIAKVIPFTLLAVFLTNPNFFNFGRIIGHLVEIPSHYGNILLYMTFVIIIEVFLRFFDLVFRALGLESGDTETEEQKD